MNFFRDFSCVLPRYALNKDLGFFFAGSSNKLTAFTLVLGDESCGFRTLESFFFNAFRSEFR